MTMYQYVKNAIQEIRNEEVKIVYERVQDEKWGLSLREAQVSEAYIKSVTENIMKALFADMETHGRHLR